MDKLRNSVKVPHQEENLVTQGHPPSTSVEEESRPRHPSAMPARITKTPDRSQLQITGSVTGEIIYVTTIHLSCKSDTYRGDHQYAGVIIYQYHGKTDWRTENGTHCKSGYVVILDTNSEKVNKWKPSSPGVVHGAVYRSAFGEQVDTTKVVGEGFSVQRGSLEKDSGVFNNPSGSEHHDDRREVNELSWKCIEEVIQSWMAAGPGSLGCRNFPVEDLLSR